MTPEPKSEKLGFRIENGEAELVDIFAKVTGQSKSDVARQIFLLGLEDATREHLNDDSQHWAFGFQQIKKITINWRFKENVARMIQKNKSVERRET